MGHASILRPPSWNRRPYANQVYHKIDHIQVELYTKLKDQEAEDRVENALSSLYWDKTEEYIDSERCYQILYEIEV